MQLRGQGKIVFIYFPFILERILFYFFLYFSRKSDFKYLDITFKNKMR